ncbi:MAG: hypothetical protein ACT4OP_03190 [Actinomycetota bacterium]
MFRIDLSAFGLGTARLVFSDGTGPGATAVHLALLPMSLHKRPATKPLMSLLNLLLPSVLIATTVRVFRRRMRASHHRPA